jgi:hypothetical protein
MANVNGESVSIGIEVFATIKSLLFFSDLEEKDDSNESLRAAFGAQPCRYYARLGEQSHSIFLGTHFKERGQIQW